MFGIKDGYRENPCAVYFLDDVTSERNIVFQPDVYTFAEWAALVAGVDQIIDVGCGWADKLEAMHHRHPDWSYVGIDHGENLEHCRAVHNWGAWVEIDLEYGPTDEVSIQLPALGEEAVVICSDVIEHLEDPRPLLAMIRNMNPVVTVLSTPDRDAQYGADHMGPPPNLCHVREWNSTELRAFLEGEGFVIKHVGLTRGNDLGPAMATQLVVI